MKPESTHLACISVGIAYMIPLRRHEIEYKASTCSLRVIGKPARTPLLDLHIEAGHSHRQAHRPAERYAADTMARQHHRAVIAHLHSQLRSGRIDAASFCRQLAAYRMSHCLATPARHTHISDYHSRRQSRHYKKFHTLEKACKYHIQQIYYK